MRRLSKISLKGHAADIHADNIMSLCAYRVLLCIVTLFHTTFLSK